MDLVRGAHVETARRILKFNSTKAAKIISKTLGSAVSNAKNNSGLNENDLYISHLQADGGPTQKRGRIVARSRFSPILKRSSHVVVGLSEVEKKPEKEVTRKAAKKVEKKVEKRAEKKEEKKTHAKSTKSEKEEK